MLCSHATAPHVDMLYTPPAPATSLLHDAMNLSPISSSASSSSPSSSTSNLTLHQHHVSSTAHRRRSVDNGGLQLAVNDHSGSGSGKGWGGWEPDPRQALSGPIDYAELVLAMREQTNTTIDHAYPATATTFLPSAELEAQREKLIHRLALWNFDASHLPPDEVFMCTNLLFEALWAVEGMEESMGFGFDCIPPFLCRVSKIYREQTSYHNFQHALDVLQAVHCYLQRAGCVPDIKILLEQQDTFIVCAPIDEAKGKQKVATANIILPATRCRKVWRRPRPGGPDTLLQRTLRNQDLFALYVAAVGHDIGHPGLSNTFMKNAKTPLAELFDDVSVLEKMHCTLLLQVMRKHRMGHLLDRVPSRSPFETRFSTQSRLRTESDPGIVIRAPSSACPAADGSNAELSRPATPPTPLPMRPPLMKSPSAYPDTSEAASSGTGTEFRMLLMKTILATDMAVHFKWMPQIEELQRQLERDALDEDAGKPPENIDADTRLLLCQAIIKCADISNPSRPHPVCKHWSASLLAEWTEQALLEEQLALPISVNASDDPIQEAEGQVSFIKMFTYPLLVATSAVIPEMEVFAKQCDTNIALWQDKVTELRSKATLADGSPPPDLNAPASDSSASSPLALPTSPPDVSTMFALSLPAALYTPNSDPRGQPAWPVLDPSSSPVMMTEVEDATHPRPEAQTPNGSRSPSPPAQPSHRRRTSHTQLPQVSIPAVSTPFSPSNSQHAKSSSSASASASSPLFSPRSIPTSSSSPRSDISSAGSGASVATSALALHFRPGLRAAYDANGRPKAMKRLENRTSWQGTVAVNTATESDAATARGSSALPTPVHQHMSNGS